MCCRGSSWGLSPGRVWRRALHCVHHPTPASCSLVSFPLCLLQHIINSTFTVAMPTHYVQKRFLDNASLLENVLRRATSSCLTKLLSLPLRPVTGLSAQGTGEEDPWPGEGRTFVCTGLVRAPGQPACVWKFNVTCASPDTWSASV